MAWILLSSDIFVVIFSMLLSFFSFSFSLYKPQRQKTYLWTSAPSENSDQPVHMHSLISFFTGHIRIPKDANFLHVISEDSE